MQHNSDPALEPTSPAPADDSGMLSPQQLLELADAIAAMLADPDPEPHGQS